MKAFIIKSNTTTTVEYILTWAQDKLTALKNYSLLELDQLTNIKFTAREIPSILAGSMNNKHLYDNVGNTKSMFYRIDGYYKDNGLKFKDRIVCRKAEKLSKEIDESIFMYGLSESKIKLQMKMGIRNDFDFVITKYSKL